MSNRYSTFSVLDIATAINEIKKIKTDQKKNEDQNHLENVFRKLTFAEFKENDSPKKLVKVKQTTKDNLEEEIEETEESVINVDYSFQEEQFFGSEIYSKKPLNYLELFYGNKNPETTAETLASDTETETLAPEEAEQTIIKVIYASIMNNMNEISYQARKKIDNLWKYNIIMAKLYHRLHAVTDDVNYSLAY
ncbi:MAG: hypothetical protein KKH52_04930 [Nanoarchaeota archaeon]|nr:hypothetical protein [Nanoarchaeota archaeon]MBU1622881.1 hypothetical protein [Nanoarchaeota archaeon]MBU1974710.1 hypothetical protein [Nanoarchaeota archaeon]